ncbi:MAG: type II toxin-antitoxin system HicA family toxin [Actinobacteria bacterium]|nr:type II toxin-antitoxin system HicA family toxin [Actinomycetota bacterium]
MAKRDKTRAKVMSGKSDRNIRFADLRSMLKGFGFEERIVGSHHIFVREGIPELVDIQSEGSEAKDYQVKQVRNLFRKYNIG